MKVKISFLGILIVISCLSGLSQKSFMNYGNIPDEDMSMTSYSNDTSAEAVVLGSYGQTLFDITEDRGFFLRTVNHYRFKILKKSALHWADFTIKLYVQRSGVEEEVTLIKGTTL